MLCVFRRDVRMQLPVQFGRDPLNFGPIRFAMSRTY